MSAGNPCKRIAALAAVLVVLASLSACGGSRGDARTLEPATTTIPADAAAARFPADRIVWQAETDGGVRTEVASAVGRPSLTIYGDGRWFGTAPGLDPTYDQPVLLQTGRVAPAALAVFVAQAKASGLFAPGTTFAEPRVTDNATTSATLHGEGEPVRISAYALGGRFDADLPAEAVLQRETFRRLLGAAEALVPVPQPWTPPRVRVLRLADAATFTPKPGDRGQTTPVHWDGPPLATLTAAGPGGIKGVEGCGVVSGDAAGRLLAAAVANPTPRWYVGGAIRTIVVVALLPGEPACGPNGG